MATLANTSPADLLADYLCRTSFGLFPDSADGETAFVLKVGEMPDAPDLVVVLYDTSAPAGFPGLLLEYAGIQVMVRGGKGAASYSSAYLMARKVRDYILGMPNAPAEFVELDGVIERGSINSLGVDDSNRPRFTNNFQLQIEPQPNTITTNVTGRMAL